MWDFTCQRCGDGLCQLGSGCRTDRAPQRRGHPAGPGDLTTWRRAPQPLRHGSGKAASPTEHLTLSARHWLLRKSKGNSSLLDSALIQQVARCPSARKGLQSIDKKAKRLHKATWAEAKKSPQNPTTNPPQNKQTKKNFCSLAK